MQKHKKVTITIFIFLIPILFIPYGSASFLDTHEIPLGETIEFYGNESFEGNSLVNGLGTESNPYIIQDQKFIGQYILKFYSTSSYVVVKNCSFLGNQESSSGIYAVAASNLIIRNCTFMNLEYGIHLDVCRNSSIQSCILIDTYYGIRNEFGVNIVIYNNAITKSNFALSLFDGVGCIVDTNNLFFNDYGLNPEMYSGSIVKNNIFFMNKKAGIFLGNSHANNFSRNLFVCNSYGILNSGNIDSNNLFFENVFINNSIPVSLEGNIQNQWNTSQFGNYWDDYGLQYSITESSEGYYYSVPYEIGDDLDNFPLILPPIQVIDILGLELNLFSFPIIYSPVSNLNFFERVGSLSLNFTLFDESILNGSYSLKKDGLEIKSGSWKHGQTLNFPLASLDFEKASYNLYVDDGMGNSSEFCIEIIIQIKIVPGYNPFLILGLIFLPVSTYLKKYLR